MSYLFTVDQADKPRRLRIVSRRPLRGVRSTAGDGAVPCCYARRFAPCITTALRESRADWSTHHGHDVSCVCPRTLTICRGKPLRQPGAGQSRSARSVRRTLARYPHGHRAHAFAVARRHRSRLLAQPGASVHPRRCRVLDETCAAEGCGVIPVIEPNAVWPLPRRLALRVRLRSTSGSAAPHSVSRSVFCWPVSLLSG